MTFRRQRAGAAGKVSFCPIPRTIKKGDFRHETAVAGRSSGRLRVFSHGAFSVCDGPRRAGLESKAFLRGAFYPDGCRGAATLEKSAGPAAKAAERRGTAHGAKAGGVFFCAFVRGDVPAGGVGFPLCLYPPARLAGVGGAGPVPAGVCAVRGNDARKRLARSRSSRAKSWWIPGSTAWCATRCIRLCCCYTAPCR